MCTRLYFLVVVNFLFIGDDKLMIICYLSQFLIIFQLLINTSMDDLKSVGIGARMKWLPCTSLIEDGRRQIS